MEQTFCTHPRQGTLIDVDSNTGTAWDQPFSSPADIADAGFVRRFNAGGFNFEEAEGGEVTGTFDNIGVNEFARAGVLTFQAMAEGMNTIELNVEEAVALANGGTFDNPNRVTGMGSVAANGEIDFSQVLIDPADRGVVVVTHTSGGGQTGTVVESESQPSDGPLIVTTIVRNRTNVGQSGSIPAVPQTSEWVHEWDSFWVEAWGSTADGSIDGSAFNLAYNTDYFTATEIDGAVSDVVMDDATGLVTGLGGQVEQLVPGGGHVLLGRVKFESVGTDQVPLGGPYDSGIEVLNAVLTIDGGSVTPTVDNTAQDTEVWPVVFDFDDNGSVGFGDVAILASSLSSDVSESDSALTWFTDLDKSGIVGFGDVSLLVQNFGVSRDSADQLVFRTGGGRDPAGPWPPGTASPSGSAGRT